MINPSKSKEGAQRDMGQTGTPHGVPLSGNGMSPATGGLWDLGDSCWVVSCIGAWPESLTRRGHRISNAGSSLIFSCRLIEKTKIPLLRP